MICFQWDGTTPILKEMSEHNKFERGSPIPLPSRMSDLTKPSIRYTSLPYGYAVKDFARNFSIIVL